MKIISVKAEAFTIPLPRKFHGSNYIYTHKKGMFAHAKTDSDVSGICYLGDDFGLGKQIANASMKIFQKYPKLILVNYQNYQKTLQSPHQMSYWG